MAANLIVTPYRVSWIHRAHYGYNGWSTVGTTFVATLAEGVALLEKPFGQGITEGTCHKARGVVAHPVSDKHPDGWGWGPKGGWDVAAERKRKQTVVIKEKQS